MKSLSNIEKVNDLILLFSVAQQLLRHQKGTGRTRETHQPKELRATLVRGRRGQYIRCILYLRQ